MKGDELVTHLLDKYALYHGFAERNARDARELERRAGEQTMSSASGAASSVATVVEDNNWWAARDYPPCGDSWTSETWRVHPSAKAMLDDFLGLEKQFHLDAQLLNKNCKLTVNEMNVCSQRIRTAQPI
jgi:hypothetical protein